MKLRFLMVTLSLIMMLVCGPSFALPSPDVTNRADLAAVVKGNNTFAFDLYSSVAAEKGNLFFSPYSVSTALAMTYAGARRETARQMEQTLHFDLAATKLNAGFSELMEQFNVADQGYQLAVANALWGQQGTEFCPEFIAITKKYYDAGFRQVDYINNTEAARQTINKWVETKTKQKIVELLEPGILDYLTRLVLTNAIYFKGKWEVLFNPEQTKEAPFMVSNEAKPNVPLMYQFGEFKYGMTDQLQIVELPYQGSDLVMDILLPTSKSDLGKLESGLQFADFQALLAKMSMREVAVFLPRFKIEKAISLGDYLQGLGMKDAFDPYKADFSGIAKLVLYISHVIHKAFVEVNEEGTEAAAATAVVMRKESISPVFRADHPFLFLIRDLRSGSILFMGRMVDPS